MDTLERSSPVSQSVIRVKQVSSSSYCENLWITDNCICKDILVGSYFGYAYFGYASTSNTTLLAWQEKKRVLGLMEDALRSLQDQGRSRHTILQFKSLKEGCQYLEIILDNNGWWYTSIWKQRSGMAMMSKWIMTVHISTLTLCDTCSLSP